MASSFQVHNIEFEYQQINAFYVIILEQNNRNLKVTKMNMKIIKASCIRRNTGKTYWNFKYLITFDFQWLYYIDYGTL